MSIDHLQTKIDIYLSVDEFLEDNDINSDDENSDDENSDDGNSDDGGNVTKTTLSNLPDEVVHEIFKRLKYIDMKSLLISIPKFASGIIAYFDFVDNVDFSDFFMKWMIIKKMYSNPNIVKSIISSTKFMKYIKIHSFDILVGAIKSNYLDLTKFLISNGIIDPSVKNNQAIILASQYADENIIELLLNDTRVDPFIRNNEVFIKMVERGYNKIVEILLKDVRCSPYATRTGFNLAIQEGNIEIVKILLKDKFFDPGELCDKAIINAIDYSRGNISIVKILLDDPRFNPGGYNNEAISSSSSRGYIEIVKLLLKDPRVDPTANDNAALKAAIYYGNTKVVQLLQSIKNKK